MQDACDPEGNINFASFYYCTLWPLGPTPRNLIFIPLGLFCLFLFFYLLGDTADEYLSPSLERLTLISGISESLAGVTLLAFGNGAPDIFSSISSAQSATKASASDYIGDNSSAASALLGSTFFIITVVIALVTRAAKPNQKVQVTPVFFIRDLLGIFIVLLYLMVHQLFVGYINIYSAFGYFVLYFAFVTIVVVTNRRKSGKKEQDGGEAKLHLAAPETLTLTDGKETTKPVSYVA